MILDPLSSQTLNKYKNDFFYTKCNIPMDFGSQPQIRALVTFFMQTIKLNDISTTETEYAQQLFSWPGDSFSIHAAGCALL